MFRKILDTVTPWVSGVNALDLIGHIHDHDRWSSFDRHHEAALYCLRKMKEHGLEAEIFELPANGETTYGDWVMPRAWVANSAKLILLPTDGRGEVPLCDYREEPCSLVVYSKPTPPEGVTAEVVVVNGGSRAGDYGGLDVEDKIAFTKASARTSRIEALKHGALGIMSDYLPVIDYYRPSMELPDCRFWERFSTDYGGWGMKKGDVECWGFVLTPRQGQWLRELIHKEGKVRAHAEVDACFYDGTVDVVTGRVPGKTDEEVLINGHLFEVGAIDDASGCGLAIEVLRCLNALIEGGRLERPKRGIRMLFTYECMGTMGAVVERPEIFKHTIAGITLDCVGGNEALCRAYLGLSRNPHSQSSYTDSLLRLIMEHLAHTDRLLVNWRERPFLSADNIVADPSIGVPCPLLIEHPYTFYHSSMDTPDKLDPRKLAWIGRAVATYAYFIANAGEREAKWLIEQVLGEAQKAIVNESNERITAHYEGRGDSPLERLLRGLSYLQTRYGIALDSVVRLVGGDEHAVRARSDEAKTELRGYAEAAFESAARALGLRAEKPKPMISEYKREASQIVPKRLVIGSFQMTRIPAEERREWSRKCQEWKLSGAAIQSAQLWCDGNRTVAEIEELVEGETGESNLRLLEYFKDMERYGYVRCLLKQS